MGNENVGMVDTGRSLCDMGLMEGVSVYTLADSHHGGTDEGHHADFLNDHAMGGCCCYSAFLPNWADRRIWKTEV